MGSFGIGRDHIWVTESPPASTSRGVNRRSLIAASLSFLIIGSGLGFLARNPPNEDDDGGETIRALEAQYMSLYSAETLLDMDSSSAMLSRGLARTAQDIGLTLTEDQLVVSGAELKMVRMLRYDSTSIAQIAWMHARSLSMNLWGTVKTSTNIWASRCPGQTLSRKAFITMS